MEGGKLDVNFLAQADINFFVKLTIWGSFSREILDFFKTSDEYTPLDSVGIFEKSWWGFRSVWM